MTTIPLLIIIALSLVATLHPDFHDNFLQRIGLSLVCLGAVAKLSSVVTGYGNPEAQDMALLWGMASYGIGTAKNAIKYRAHNRVKIIRSESHQCQN